MALAVAAGYLDRPPEPCWEVACRGPLPRVALLLLVWLAERRAV